MNAEGTAPQSDYAQPPELQTARREPQNMVALIGVSRPDAMIRLASPDGGAIGAKASHDGAWSLTVPGGPAPRLYSLSEDQPGQPLRARGYVAALPAPGAPAAILRPGAGVDSLGAADAGLTITGVDFDRSGVGVASGRAKAGEVVRITLDGTEVGEDTTSPEGVFAVPLSQSLHGGAHVLSAQARSGAASAAFRADATAPLLKPGFLATRERDAWRIDWTTPGGGVQTTIIFDPKAPA